jgi:UDP-GlcNAc:undecaprenyl-phosphate GlcNAc-1-phosphate transferase
VTLPTVAIVPLAALLGVAATRLARDLSLRLGLVSRPNSHVITHVAPVACLGGVALAAATAVTLALDAGRAHVGAGMIGGALLFLAAGLLDDVHTLGVSTKLALQIVCAAAAAALGATLPLTGEPVLDAAGGAALIVVIVNAVNLTDVCDGLVAGLAVITLLAVATAEPSLAVPCLALAGACLGFLVYNAPPASIYLGDCGSNLVGFALAALLLAFLREGESVGGVQVALFVGVPLFELVFVVLARVRRREPWWRGSADHVSLRLQAAGLSRWQVDAVAWTAAGALALAGLSYTHLAVAGQIALLVGLLAALTVISHRLLQREEPVTRGRS